MVNDIRANVSRHESMSWCEAGGWLLRDVAGNWRRVPIDIDRCYSGSRRVRLQLYTEVLSDRFIEIFCLTDFII